jgi:hypothetical protein
METAKVDIRKLQLLNDRINQCIDALNQVRLSVHGLQHANPQQLWGQVGTGFGQPPGLGVAQQPGFGQQFGQGIQGAQVYPGPIGPAFGGFGHSSPGYLQGLSGGQELFAGGQGWVDPQLSVRIAQTFPYAQYPITPFAGY